MSARDDFLRAETTKLLQPGETVTNTGAVFTGPLLMSSMFGVIGQLMMLTHYYAVLTNRRLIMIETGMGFTGIKTENRGVTEIPFTDIHRVTTGGFLNQKSITVERKNGSSLKINYNTMVRQVTGQKEFCAALVSKLQSAAT